MKNINFSLLISILLISLGLIGCEKEIELKVNNIDKNLVIESVITNEPGPYYVRLTKTTDYYTPNVFEGVPNATIILTETAPDATVRIDTLIAVDSLVDYGNFGKRYGGFYRTNKISQSTPRAVYRLQVLVEGKEHTATTILPDYVGLDTVVVRYVPNGESALRPEGYYVTVIGKEPDTLGNNYRLVGYRNDTLLDQPAYIIGEDRLVNNIPIIRELPWNFKQNDTVEIQLRAINKETFLFYQSLSRQLFAGSPFAPPGENVKSNFTNGAVGFFTAYTIHHRRLRIR